MKIIARHLTGDFYNCREASLQGLEPLERAVRDILRDAGHALLGAAAAEAPGNHLALSMVFDDGHIALHAYRDLRYVAVDIFLCKEDAEPEQLFRAFRSFFQPDKTKTTILKRGDFGKEKDIRPKTKTRVAPLRRIHNTGAKVIRILARRSNK